MTNETITQHLQTVYPEGAPARIQGFFAGDITDEGERRVARDEIARSAENYLKEHAKIRGRIAEIEFAIAAQRPYLATIEGELSQGDYLHFDVEWLAEKLYKKQAHEYIVTRAAQEVAELKTSPYFDNARATAWAELQDLVADRTEVEQPPEFHQVESMSVAEMLAIVFTDNVRVPCYDLRLDERFARASNNHAVPHQKKVEWLASRLERGEIGGDVCQAIADQITRYGAAGDRIRRLCCDRLLEIACEKRPELRKGWDLKDAGRSRDVEASLRGEW